MRPAILILLLALTSPISADECDRFRAAIGAFDASPNPGPLREAVEAAFLTIDATSDKEDAVEAYKTLYRLFTDRQLSDRHSAWAAASATLRIVYVMVCRTEEE